MAFPAVSEAFAGVEVGALIRAGAEVEIATLRTASKRHKEILTQWRLGSLKVGRCGMRTALAFPIFAISNPWKVFRTMGWLIRSGYRRPLLLFKCLVFFPRMIEIFAEISRSPPDVLHLFWGHFPAVLGYMTRRWLPQTVVSTSLGAYDLLYDFPPAAEVARCADCVWTHAESNRPSIAALGVDPRKIHVAIRGIDLSLVPHPMPKRIPHRIVTAGRVIPEKGMEGVIRVVTSLAKRFPDSELVVIGDGPDRRRLEDIVSRLSTENRVVFRGAVSHREVFAILASASVFMLLSRWSSERLPNVVKEALSCGCICVVSKTPGIQELLTALKYPMVVDAEDLESATRLVSTVFENPDQFEGERKRGMEFSQSQLNADDVARRRLLVWRDAKHTVYQRA